MTSLDIRGAHAMDVTTPSPHMTADAALHRLIEGNARYRSGQSRFIGMRPEVLAELSHGQEPFAIILGCADARVPPELIFDAVRGELFVIRVAGHILSPEVAASLDYAGTQHDTPLFVVLGHEGCGTVKAALDTHVLGGQPPRHLAPLVAAIGPALDGIGQDQAPWQQLAQAVEANVRLTMTRIAESVEGHRRLEAGRMLLVGAIYDMATGRVRLLDVV